MGLFVIAFRTKILKIRINSLHTLWTFCPQFSVQVGGEPNRMTFLGLGKTSDMAVKPCLILPWFNGGVRKYSYLLMTRYAVMSWLQLLRRDQTVWSVAVRKRTQYPLRERLRYARYNCTRLLWKSYNSAHRNAAWKFRGGSTLGQLVQIQKLADRPDVISDIPKCSKIQIFRGSAADLAVGAYSVPPEGD